MKRFFSLSFRKKAILILLLINVPFFLTGYLAKGLTEGMILHEKEEKLLAFGRMLNIRLESGGFAALLARQGAENAPREEKIKILNQALRGLTDEVASASPGMGIGYYSRALDAILTYGPSSSYGNTVGVSIPADHPGRIVMSTNKPLVRFGSMVRGNIMNAMVPIERGGEVIGYIWANELTTDIETQFSTMAQNLFIAMLLCCAVTICLLLLISRQTIRDVDRIIQGVRAMRFDLSKRIGSAGGEMGEVVNSINAMAEDIDKANEDSRRAIAVLQIILSYVDAVVYVCDPHNKRLVYVNDYLCSLVGRSDIHGELCYEVLQGRSTPCPFCPQQQLFDKEGNPVSTLIHWETHNSILNRDFLVTDRLITWHDGRLLHMEVGTDITERKALAVAEAANLAQRDFLSRMSHELRTPMNGVLGMARLAMQADPPPAQLEYLKKIQSSASLLLGIINDILDFSRIEAGKLTVEKRAFSLRVMVENVRELIMARVEEKNLEFNVVIADSVPEYAVGDELRLSQVLLNLLGNAVKFTLQGSVVLEMHATSLPEGRLRLECSVKDSGIGMDQKQQSALFNPFSQGDSSTSREFGGTGLGLSISKALVELMGGSVGVSSAPGQGSTFSFSVELDPVDGTPESNEEKERLWADARYDGFQFLLVEDNAINQEIAAAFLSELGAQVDIADNGEEGVAAFLAKDYALIFMDMRMPIMDGLEATRHIRASGKHDAASVPIIAMTANAMREDREASEAAGMNGHIAKPIDLNELHSTLFQLLKAQAAEKKE